MPDLRLYYGDLLVGTIRNAFQNDGTWFGMVDLSIDANEGELQRRILQFVRFVEDWNERVHRNDRADPSEFDEYSSIVRSGLWFTRDDNGKVSSIEEAPVFFDGGEVSWHDL